MDQAVEGIIFISSGKGLSQVRICWSFGNCSSFCRSFLKTPAEDALGKISERIESPIYISSSTVAEKKPLVAQGHCEPCNQRFEPPTRSAAG